MQVIVQNKVVSYDRVGPKKSTVLLLHGWGADRNSLSSISKSLSDLYDVINVDVPGFGASERPDQTWGLGEYAEWLNEFMRKLELTKLYCLLGHSNGGAIAIKAVSSGLNVERLVLIGASGIRNRERGKKLFFKSVAKTGKVATAALPKKIQSKVRSKWYKTIGSELYESPGMEEFFKKVTSEDLLVDSAMISVPTMLIYGADDRATPPLYGQLYGQTIEQSTLYVVDGAGHYVFIDQPKKVISLILSYLRK